MQLEHFAESAQETFQEAQEIMHRHQHSQLDVEHIFLAMLRQPQGIAGRLLEQLDIDAEVIAQSVERELEKLPKIHGRPGGGDMVYITPRTQRLVKRADEEALQLKDSVVGVEHLLLVISGEAPGPSAQILASFNIDAERIYQALMHLRGEQPAPEAGVEQVQSSDPSGELAELRQQMAALELQNQHLQQLLKDAQDNLAYTRTLLEREIEQRHWAERLRIDPALGEQAEIGGA
jgi:ATP-dependent Clp protease ATP-binding subunit ClpA